MIQFSTNGTLPSGIHSATWQQVEELLAFNDRRRELLAGLKRACEPLRKVGCSNVYIGGSFATNKEFPGDFDVCWEDDNVDFVKLKKLDSVLLDFKTIVLLRKPNMAGSCFRLVPLPVRMVKLFWNFFSETEMGILKALLLLTS
jgi:hypothetical protein